MTDESSNKTDEWIAKAIERFPFHMELADGHETGNIVSGIARASFPYLWDRSKPIPPNTEGTYGINLVFPEDSDLSLLEAQIKASVEAKWPNPKTRPKLKLPLKDQGEMTRFEGYNDGGRYVIATSRQNKPAVWDKQVQRMHEDRKDEVYPGCRVIATIRPFTYDKGVNRGVSFGLQEVQLVADDKRLGGFSGTGGAFSGVDLDNEEDEFFA